MNQKDDDEIIYYIIRVDFFVSKSKAYKHYPKLLILDGLSFFHNKTLKN